MPHGVDRSMKQWVDFREIIPPLVAASAMKLCLEEPGSKRNSRLERSERRNGGLHIIGQSRALAGKTRVLKRVIARAGFLPGFFMLIWP